MPTPFRAPLAGVLVHSIAAFDYFLRRDRWTRPGAQREAGPDPRICGVDAPRTHGRLGQPRTGRRHVNLSSILLIPSRIISLSLSLVIVLLFFAGGSESLLSAVIGVYLVCYLKVSWHDVTRTNYYNMS